MSGIDSVKVNSNRIGFIDQCKGIGIILMVFGHCITEEYSNSAWGIEQFSRWFSSFHMPLFFIIGGILLAYKNETFIFPKTLVKKAKQLLLPGLYFSCLSIMTFTLVKALSKEDVFQYLKDRVFELLTLQLPDAMWFLPCYFFAEILFLLFVKQRRFKLQLLLISIVSFLLSVLIKYLPEVDIVTKLSRLFMAICFICIGYMLYQFFLYKYYQKGSQAKADPFRLKGLLFGGGIILIAIGATGAFFNGAVGCSTAGYGKNPILFLIDAVAGSVGLLLVFSAIGKRIPPLEFFGKNSLIVLCTHLIIINIFWMLNGKLFHIELSEVKAPLLALGVLLLEIPSIMIINKFFPFLIGRKRQKKYGSE